MTYICYPTSYTPDPTVAPVLNGGTFISKVPDNKTAQDEVAGMGLEINQVAIFEDTDFTTSELHFVECFNIESDNTVTFDLDKAKDQTLVQVRASINTRVDGYGFKRELLIAQSSLPESSRIPEVQAFFDAINAKASEVTTRLDNIRNATSATALTTELGINY